MKFKKWFNRIADKILAFLQKQAELKRRRRFKKARRLIKSQEQKDKLKLAKIEERKEKRRQRMLERWVNSSLRAQARKKRWSLMNILSWLRAQVKEENENVSIGTSLENVPPTDLKNLKYAEDKRPGEEYYPEPTSSIFWGWYIFFSILISLIVGFAEPSFGTFVLSLIAFSFFATLLIVYAVFDGKYLNYFFIAGYTGRSQVVAEGEGVPVKPILPFKGFRIIKSANPDRDGDVVRVPIGSGCGGFHLYNNFFMGFFGKSRLERKVQFDEWGLEIVTRKDENGNDIVGLDYTLKHHDKISPYVFHMPFDYAFEIKKAEDSKNMPLDVTWGIGGYFINIFLPFLRRDVFDTLRNNLISAVRNFIGARSFEALRSEMDIDLEEAKLSEEERKRKKKHFEQLRKEARENKEKVKKRVRKELSLYLFRLTEKIPDQPFGLKQLIKFVIATVNVIDIDISPEWAKGYRLAQQNVYKAEQDKIIGMIGADRDLYIRNKQAEGEENYVNKVQGAENIQLARRVATLAKNKRTTDVALAIAIEETGATALSLGGERNHLATLPLDERTQSPQTIAPPVTRNQPSNQRKRSRRRNPPSGSGGNSGTKTTNPTS